MIPYPSIDPVAVRIGPLAIRWYGIAYLLGFASGYAVLRRLAARDRVPLTPQAVGDLVSWLAAGVVLGGRLGYVLFYNLPYFLEHPARVLALWEGGMSFHGGLLGAAAALWAFSRRRGLGLLDMGDALALAAPPGLFFGRIANFINGELYGRVTDLPWAMVFPGGGPMGRHPSQLYEALLEGPVLWAVAAWAFRRYPGRSGAVTAAFLTGYGVFRFLVEFTREPDPQLGFVLGPFTMGQILSAGMVVAGVLFAQAAARGAAAAGGGPGGIRRKQR